MRMVQHTHPHPGVVSLGKNVLDPDFCVLAEMEFMYSSTSLKYNCDILVPLIQREILHSLLNYILSDGLLCSF